MVLRTALIASTGAVFAAGIAVAVILGTRPVAPVPAAPAAQSPAPGAASTAGAAPSSSPAAAMDPLEAAADAVGFHRTTADNVGIVENLPPDTTLLAPSKTMLAVGTVAPDFTLFTPRGERVRFSDYRGRTVLLEFFATWCPHCQAEAPHLLKLFSALPSRDFAFLSINADGEDAASLHAFDRFFHIPWPTLLDPGTPAGTFNEAGGAGHVTDAYGVALYPTFYVIDPKGRVAWRNDREQPDLLVLQKLHEAAGK